MNCEGNGTNNRKQLRGRRDKVPGGTCTLRKAEEDRITNPGIKVKLFIPVFN
jgi:hypothetical protein